MEKSEGILRFVRVVRAIWISFGLCFLLGIGMPLGHSSVATPPAASTHKETQSVCSFQKALRPIDKVFQDAISSQNTVSSSAQPSVQSTKPQPITKGEALFDRSVKLYAAGKYTETVNCLEQCLKHPLPAFCIGAAKNNLGFMLKNGMGCQKDIPRALLLFQEAVVHGDTIAWFNMAATYEHVVRLLEEGGDTEEEVAPVKSAAFKAFVAGIYKAPAVLNFFVLHNFGSEPNFRWVGKPTPLVQDVEILMYKKTWMAKLGPVLKPFIPGFCPEAWKYRVLQEDPLVQNAYARFSEYNTPEAENAMLQFLVSGVLLSW